MTNGFGVAVAGRSAPTADPLAGFIPRCSACRLFEGCNSPKMPVTGEGLREILVIAEAPGKDEDEQNIQLIGKAGQLLRRYLKAVDVDLDRDCWKTNALACRPPKNRTPTPEEIDYCRPNVANAVRELQPKVIILLGLSAVHSLLEPLYGRAAGPLSRWVGFQIPSQRFNCWICPTWHPSWILREHEKPPLDVWFKRHLQSAVDLAERPWPDGPPHYSVPPDYTKDFEVVLDPDVAASMLDAIPRDRGIMSFDYETDRLKPDHPDAMIRCCAVAWGPGLRENGSGAPAEGLAFPWHGPAIGAMRRLLIDAPLPKVGFNIQFENRWTIKEFGRGVRNWKWDGMVASHIIDNRPDITSLKFQAFVHLGQSEYSESVSPYLEAVGGNERNRVAEIDLGTLLRYNGLDAVLEWRLVMNQMRLLGYAPRT